MRLSAKPANKFPGPLHSTEHLCGLPGLSTKDSEKISLGNRLADRAGQIQRLCLLHGVVGGEKTPLPVSCGSFLAACVLLCSLASTL